LGDIIANARPARGWQIVFFSVMAMSALLIVDNDLFPLSFALRRALAFVSLGAVAFAIFIDSRSWRKSAVWAVVIASLTIVLISPSASVALAGIVIALAAISAGPPMDSARSPLSEGLTQACLTMVAIRFAVDLVPQIGFAESCISRWANQYLSRARNINFNSSFFALGGRPALFASVYLLWRWHFDGQFARLAAAAAIPVFWFFLSALIVLDPTVGLLASFGRGVLHGIAWLLIAVSLDAFLVSRGRFRAPSSTRASRQFLLVACVASIFIGICLVGTSLVGSPTGRKIVVHNRGGLDWDRPVFGRFGTFSGGMFGLLPVYCQAEGYELGIIDKDAIRRNPGQGTSDARSSISWNEAAVCWFWGTIRMCLG